MNRKDFAWLTDEEPMEKSLIFRGDELPSREQKQGKSRHYFVVFSLYV